MIHTGLIKTLLELLKNIICPCWWVQEAVCVCALSQFHFFIVCSQKYLHVHIFTHVIHGPSCEAFLHEKIRLLVLKDQNHSTMLHKDDEKGQATADTEEKACLETAPDTKQ